MSATLATRKTAGSTPGRRAASDPGSGRPADVVQVTAANVVRSEWVKFRTLRSSWVMLLAAVVSLIAFAVVLGYTTGSSWAGLDPEDSAPSAVLQGYRLVTMLIGVLGVLFVTGEYSTGMIRSTLAAVPRRTPVVVAKTLVFGAITLPAMVAASFAAFFGGQVFLAHYGHSTALTAPGVLRIVIGTGVFLALVGVLGSAIGWILRNTAGGISTYLGLLLVLPLLIGFLPSSLGSHITPYLPSNAGEAFISSVRSPDSLAPWTGLAVLVAWVVAALAVAVVQLRRRDA